MSEINEKHYDGERSEEKKYVELTTQRRNYLGSKRRMKIQGNVWIRERIVRGKSTGENHSPKKKLDKHMNRDQKQRKENGRKKYQHQKNIAENYFTQQLKILGRKEYYDGKYPEGKKNMLNETLGKEIMSEVERETL